MTQKRAYIDTSVYLGILLGEKEALALEKLLRHHILCSSVLLFAEAERNLVRLSREKILTTEEYRKAMNQLKIDLESFLLRDLTIDLCLTGFYPPVRTPRTSDLIHLLTAQWFQQNGGLELFVTLDKDQRHAAIDVGLSVN